MNEPYDVCLTRCDALYDGEKMDANADSVGDSVQCRLVQISRAALHPEQAAEYCVASQIRPAPGENLTVSPCSDPANLARNLECKKYCRIVTRACVDGDEGKYRVFQDEQQCLDTCNNDPNMATGAPGDIDVDTVRCRRYHAYFSLELPAVHCLHASATGDGHCGSDDEGNCRGYCRVLKQSCAAQFTTTFGTAGTNPDDGGLEACIEACAPAADDSGGLVGAGYEGFALPVGSPRYQLAPPPTGDTLLCRAYHAVQAVTAKKAMDAAQTTVATPQSAMATAQYEAECAAAFGGSPCQ